PVPGPDGYARRAMAYDARGNQTGESYFDAAGQPTYGPQAVTGWQAAHDDRGHVLEWTGLGPDGRPEFCKDGFARRRNTYDDGGRLTAEQLLAPDGSQVLSGGGYARRELRYADGKPCENKENYARVEYRYDPLGRVVGHTYFDAKDLPGLRRGTFHRLTLRYDDHSNLAEEVYLGPDGKPAAQPEGFASFVNEF